MTSPSDAPGSVPPRGTEPHEGPAAVGIATLANVGWQILLTMGLATIALGVIALVWPGETLRVVGVLFGVYLLATGTLVVGVVAIVLGLTEVVRAIRTRVEIGRLAAGTAPQRRPLFHARPHAQH
ncbi:DUF308 domain-containing protein [Streptomyces sp. NPDC059168]|uniref:DUF308 domain-containing protein n=1 Tax=Streptomyces sp. NPDC059168 TaxID=3346753 RepID=UPI0036D0F318